MVSRETSGPPATAAAVFGTALPQAQRLADLLATTGVDRGLLGPREPARIWDRHLLNCAVVADALPADGLVYDVGSGAGLPGLVLAIVRPDLRLVLIEPLERRAAFLSETIRVLGLDGVEVLRARAEDLQLPPADVVTARAVAPLDRLAGWCLPLLRAGGVLLAMKGDRAVAELTAAEPTLRRLGATGWSISQMGLDVLEHPTTVVRVTAGVPAGRPRRGRDGAAARGARRTGAAAAGPGRRRR